MESLANLAVSGHALVLSAFGRDGDGGLGVVGVDGVEVIDRISSKGIAFGGGDVVRVLDTTGGVRTWAHRGAFLVYDRSGQVRVEQIEGIGDVHDVLHDGDSWLIVSTADDAIVRWRADDGSSIETVYSSGHACDFTHVNCISLVDGRLVATSFASPDHWSWRTNLRKMRRAEGRLFDPSTGVVIIDQLSRPHSPRRWNGSWVVTEAGDHSLLIVDDAGVRASIGVGGFARGLLVVGDLAYVAISPPRPSLNDVAADRVDDGAFSARLIAVDLRCGAVVDSLDLPFAEVYDVVALPLPAVETMRAGAAHLTRPVDVTSGGVSMPRNLELREPLDPSDRRAGINAVVPESVRAGSTFPVTVEVTNAGGHRFVSAGVHRVLLGWWWGERPEGLRGGSGLGPQLGPGERASVQCQIEAPTRPGQAQLTIAIIQEGVGWFDGAVSFEVVVEPHGPR